MDLLSCFMWFSLVFFLGTLRWSGTAGNGVLKERAECAFPEPCYGWAKWEECNMGSTPQTSPAVIITQCVTANPRNPWSRAFRYFAYQFDLIQENGGDATEPGGVIAVSRCTKKTGGEVQRPNAIAVIRSPGINPGACLPIRVTFWYRLSHDPTFSAEPEQEYNLKVFVEDVGQSFPNEMLWGNQSDYIDVVPMQWHYAESLFGRDANQQFYINFFAYHNDDCATNLRTIAVDNIVIEQAVASSVCTPTTASTTTGSTTPTVPNPTSTTTQPTTTTITSTGSTTTTGTTTTEPTTTVTTTDFVTSTDSTTSETTTVATTPSTDSTTSETTRTTSPTSTVSPDTPETGPTSSATSTDSTTSETTTLTDSSTSTVSTTGSSTESTTTSETNTPDSSTSTDSPTSETTASTNSSTSTLTAGNATESTTTSATPSTPNTTVSTDSTVSETTSTTLPTNSTTLSSNATSGSSDTTTSTDSTTTATTTTTTTTAVICDLDCGYGRCVLQGTTYSCACNEGFVQTHSTAPCRCPATFYYNGSQCLEAPLTLGVTYTFQRDFPADLSSNTSDLHKTWSTEIANRIQSQITRNLTAELSARHVYVHVLSFRSGSVIADVLITAALYDTSREQGIKNTIETSARNIKFTLDGSDVVLESNATFGYFNRCVNVEETSACAANATCSFTSQTGKAVCECSDGFELNSDGRSCRVAAATPDISQPTSTPDGGTDALYIALYTIAGVTGAVIIVFAGIFITRRYRAKNTRPLPSPPVYQARSHRTNASNVARQQRQEAIYASINDYDGVNPRRDYQYGGAVRTPSIRSTTSSMPDYDLEDFSHRRSSGYAGSQRSFSSFHPSEQSYELYGVLPLKENRQQK